MADYFTNFSLLMSLPTEAAEKYVLDLAQQAARINQGDEQMPDNFPDCNAVISWTWKPWSRTLRLNSGLTL